MHRLITSICLHLRSVYHIILDIMHNIIYYVLGTALLTANAAASSPHGETTSEVELTFGDVFASIGFCIPFLGNQCGVCESGCTTDSDCKDELVCKKTMDWCEVYTTCYREEEHSSVPGCTDGSDSEWPVWRGGICVEQSEKTSMLKLTSQPSFRPSPVPSDKPSTQPTPGPSFKPSAAPSYSPSSQPTSQPTFKPSSIPSDMPSIKPSPGPSFNPSAAPSYLPSSPPTSSPTFKPSSSLSPTSSLAPTSSPSSHPTSFDWTSFSEELEKMVEKQKQLNAATAGEFDVVDSNQPSESEGSISEHEETTSKIDWTSFTEELEKMVEKEKQLVDSYHSSEYEETTSQILADLAESMKEIFVDFVKDIGLEDIFKDSDMPSKLDAISSSTPAEDFAEIMSEIIGEILGIFGLEDLIEDGGTSYKLDAMADLDSYDSSSSSADEHTSSENDKTESKSPFEQSPVTIGQEGIGSGGSKSSSEQSQGPVTKGQEGIVSGGSKSSSEQSQGPVTKGQEVKGKKEALVSGGGSSKKGGTKKKGASNGTGSIVSNLNTSTEDSGGPSATTITRVTLGVLATICVVALVVTTLRKRKRSRDETLPISNPPSTSISVNDEDCKSVDNEVVVPRIESIGSMKMDMSFEIPLKDARKKSASYDSVSATSTQGQHGSLSKSEEETTNMSMTSDVLSEMKATTMKKKQQLTQLGKQCGLELVLM